MKASISFFLIATAYIFTFVNTCYETPILNLKQMSRINSSSNETHWYLPLSIFVTIISVLPFLLGSVLFFIIFVYFSINLATKIESTTTTVQQRTNNLITHSNETLAMTSIRY